MNANKFKVWSEENHSLKCQETFWFDWEGYEIDWYVDFTYRSVNWIRWIHVQSLTLDTWMGEDFVIIHGK